jgi:hypothetical protein
MKLWIVLTVLLATSACSRVSANAPNIPPNEKGYRHLMKALKDRSASSCETLEHDGTTCYRVKGHDLCGKTRDEAAEVAATWIDKNIPESCGNCGK